jgi:site-specific DNA-methyltransferase (adenine-specific)
MGWTVRHYTSLWYTKSRSFKFDFTKVPRVVRKAPKKGYEGDKPISSVWTYTLSNTHRERVPYPSQKPLAVITPLVAVHTEPGDTCLDPFAGSGSLAEAAIRLGRRSIAIDSNEEAVGVIRQRMKRVRL